MSCQDNSSNTSPDNSVATNTSNENTTNNIHEQNQPVVEVFGDAPTLGVVAVVYILQWLFHYLQARNCTC